MINFLLKDHVCRGCYMFRRKLLLHKKIEWFLTGKTKGDCYGCPLYKKTFAKWW